MFGVASRVAYRFLLHCAPARLHLLFRDKMARFLRGRGQQQQQQSVEEKKMDTAHR